MQVVYWDKLKAVKQACGLGDHVRIRVDPETDSLSNLVDAKLDCAVFEASDAFKTLNDEERANHEEIHENIAKLERVCEQKYGEKCREQVDLAIALDLASKHIPKKSGSSNVTGLHAYQYLPLQLFGLHHNEKINTAYSLSLFKFSVGPEIQELYGNALALLERKDSSVHPVVLQAIERLKLDFSALKQANQTFVNEYMVLADQCDNPLSEENKSRILAALPEEQRAAAKDALEFLSNFPEKPTLRDCDRYYGIVQDRHHDGVAIPYRCDKKADETTQLLYSALTRNLEGHSTPDKRLKQIARSVYDAEDEVGEEAVTRVVDLDKLVGYFTTAYEKVAYPGKLLAYQNNKLSNEEMIDKIKDHIIKNHGDRYLMNKERVTSRATVDDVDIRRFDTYFENKAAFESIKEAVLYGEPVHAPAKTLSQAQAFLLEIESKTREVVAKIRDRDTASEGLRKESSSFWDAFEKKDIGESWSEKLNDALQYSTASTYIGELDENVAKLEKFRERITALREKLGAERGEAIATASYDTGLAVTISHVPNEIKPGRQGKVNTEKLEELQQYLNSRLPSMDKHFSVLQAAPVVKVSIGKHGLVVSIQEVSNDMVKDGFKKLFNNDEAKITEAAANGGKGVVSAVASLLRIKYPFLKPDEIDTGVGGNKLTR